MNSRDFSGIGGLCRDQTFQGPDGSKSAVLLERFFISGLEYLSQGVHILTKLREKLGSNSSTAKSMISTSLEQLRMALGEFNIFLERQSEVAKDEETQSIEMEQIKKLLQEYREELENVRGKNRELRELIALKMDARDRSRDIHDEDYEADLNDVPPNRRQRSNDLHFGQPVRVDNWAYGRIDDVTFGKKNAQARSKIPDEMFKSSHSHLKNHNNDESSQEKHNRSYMSINLDKGIEGHFAKKERPHVHSSHGKKLGSNIDQYHSEGFKNRQNNLKGSQYLGFGTEELNHFKSIQSTQQSKALENEISSLDAKILSLMSEVYDEFNLDLRSPGATL